MVYFRCSQEELQNTYKKDEEKIMFKVYDLTVKAMGWELVFEGTKSECYRYAKFRAGAHRIVNDKGETVWYC